MYSIEVKRPALTTHGKVARNTKFKVTSIHGDSARTMTAGQLCKEQGLALPAMLRHVRFWDEGWHTEKFQALVDKMRANLRGSYGKQGRKLNCPTCNALHHKNDFIFHGRRMRRDASPVGSVLRGRPAEYFGESATTAAESPTEAGAVTNTPLDTSGE